MKRIIAFVLIFILLTPVVLAEGFKEKEGYGQDAHAFIGLKWGESIENVQLWYGKGEVTKTNNWFASLTYNDLGIAGYNAWCSMYFVDDKLDKIVMNCYDSTKNTNMPDNMLIGYQIMYGEYIMLDNNAILFQKYEPVENGDIYWWFIDEYTGCYLEKYPNMITVNYVILK